MKLDMVTTADLRKALYNYLSVQGTYVCHEVAIPKDREYAITRAKELNTEPIFTGRVDMLTYSKNYRMERGEFRFYEMKISVGDFNSVNGHNFDGNYNYYVLPSQELFEKVSDKIPKDVGCLVYRGTNSWNGRSHFECVKKPRRRDLCCDYMNLIHNFITALSRECCIHNVGYYKAR